MPHLAAEDEGDVVAPDGLHEGVRHRVHSRVVAPAPQILLGWLAHLQQPAAPPVQVCLLAPHAPMLAVHVCEHRMHAGLLEERNAQLLHVSRRILTASRSMRSQELNMAVSSNLAVLRIQLAELG